MTRENRPETRRILVVDDHLDTVHTMAYLLRDRGHEVRFAINGYAALELARDFSPDVVVLDLNLPDIDGVDVARKIKQSPRGKSIRIFALTGREKAGDTLRAFEAGCEQHLSKPLDPSVLDRLLDEPH